MNNIYCKRDINIYPLSCPLNSDPMESEFQRGEGHNTRGVGQIDE